MERPDAYLGNTFLYPLPAPTSAFSALFLVLFLPWRDFSDGRPGPLVRQMLAPPWLPTSVGGEGLRRPGRDLPEAKIWVFLVPPTPTASSFPFSTPPIPGAGGLVHLSEVPGESCTP